MAQMFRARLASLTLVAALSAIALSAPSASAAIKFEWSVNGKLLQEGETRAVQSSEASKAWDYHGNIFGVLTLILFPAPIIHPGRLNGGRRGRWTLPRILFRKPIVHRPTLCTITGENVESTPLVGEIVEGQGTKEPLVLIAPETGTTIATFDFAGESCSLKGTETLLTGSFLGLLSSVLTELLRQDLSFPVATSEYLLGAGGSVRTALLLLAGNDGSLTGLTLLILESDEKFGAF